MAQRRCLQTLTRRAIAALSTSLHQTLKSTLPSIENLFPFRYSLVFTNNTCNHHHYHTLWSDNGLRYFSSNSGDGSEDDDEETAEEEDSDDDVANDSDLKLRKSPEEEAEAIGYKVIGPLGENERVIKTYEPVFAVVQIGSHQFKVSNGDCIFTERLKFCDVNDKLILNKVLLLGSKTQTIVGRPMVPDAVVHAIVEEHALDAKVIIFKKKRRKNYRRTKGHRQELTKLRITDIQGIEKPEIKVDTKPRKIVVKKQEKVPV